MFSPGQGSARSEPRLPRPWRRPFRASHQLGLFQTSWKSTRFLWFPGRSVLNRYLGICSLAVSEKNDRSCFCQRRAELMLSQLISLTCYQRFAHLLAKFWPINFFLPFDCLYVKPLIIMLVSENFRSLS